MSDSLIPLFCSIFVLLQAYAEAIKPRLLGRWGRVAAMQVVNLDRLKRDGLLWQGRQQRLASAKVLPSGWPALDGILGGGWPRAALSEVLGEAHRGLPLLLPLLARLSAESRWLMWVAPPYVPYAPALAAHGIQIERMLLVQDVSTEQSLWATEQALKSGSCGLVMAWPGQVQTGQLRRLQLAAEQGGCPGILFRRLRAGREGSPAALRLRVRPAPLGLEVEMLKRRGGWGGESCIVPLEGPRPDLEVLNPDSQDPGTRP